MIFESASRKGIFQKKISWFCTFFELQDGLLERSLSKVKWKKGITQYQDEEMVNYSLSRWLKSKISMEMIEISQINRIQVIPEKEDLIFVIHFELQDI